MGKVTVAEDIDKKELRDQYQTALTQLQQIIDAPSSTQQEVGLARIVRRLMRIIRQLV